MSLFFVIGTTIELAIVLLIKRKKYCLRDRKSLNKSKNRCTRNGKEQTPLQPQKSTSFETYIRYSDNDLEKERKVKPSRYISYSTTDKVDFAALITFLSLFLLFNCGYILKYM